MKEPSVLDYIKAKLNPWRGKFPQLPFTDIEQERKMDTETRVEPERERVSDGKIITRRISLPWKSVCVMGLALAAQRLLEPPESNTSLAVILYLLAATLLIVAIFTKEWEIASLREDTPERMPDKIRRNPFLIGLPLLLLAFIAFGGNRFTILNCFLWVTSIIVFFRSLWTYNQAANSGSWKRNFMEILHEPSLDIRISLWGLLLCVAILVALFFRFYQLDQIPGEMFSDHAEKLLDVSDVLNGQLSIFFPRNTGREAFQMYLTAVIVAFFHTGLSFMSLKIGTALAGFFTLLYIFLLGKEIGDRWVGLLAFILAGVAYWPNVISRVGLRFTLYPLFVAPTLYYLIRGLRTSNRNDFLLSGLALGIGLHGYSPFRIVPFVVVVAVIIYILHGQSKGKRWQTISALFTLAFIALLVFLPLLRYVLEYPDMFGYRAFSRFGTMERSFPGPVWKIFLGNLWNALIMVFWKNGNIWVHSVTGRPALDVVTAALFFLGSVQIFIRYLRRRHWLDLFLLLSVPLLMMPSILSLAFPNENPSLNRTAGAIIPICLIAAIAMEGFIRSMIIKTDSNLRKGFALLLCLFLLGWSLIQNFDLVFHQYNKQFKEGAWNTSEIGRVIQGFANSVGSRDSAYVVPYSHWVDTRLVGINAGFPQKDYALWSEDFEKTLNERNAKLFVLKPEDHDSVNSLKDLYPTGVLWLRKAPLDGKDFYLFFVSPIQ